MRRRRSMRADDAGAALPLVLIVVTVFALIIAGSLAFADTSIRTTVNLRDQAAVNYSADGATDAAVNALRKSTYNGESGQCFGSSNILNLPSFSGSKSATVTCAANPSSRVLIACPSLSNCNRPGAAILALGNVAGEDGIYIKANNNGQFKVHGIVLSNSTINVNQGSLATNNGVYARGGASGCTGSVTTDTTPIVSKACQNSVGLALNADPNYPADVTVVPAPATLPNCSGSTIQFSPGYYDDAVALTALTSGAGQCGGKTVLFSPGVYYFDFHNGENAALAAGSHLWTLTNLNLVAGTPTPGMSMTAPTIPGACVNPIESASAQGVQFIFGNDSQLLIDNKVNAEFCGTYRTNKPPLVMYGMTSGAETSTAVNGSMSPTADNGQFTSVNNMTNTDNATANWTYAAGSGNGLKTGSVTVSGFAPTTAVPAGSTLKSATLTVVHRNTTASNNDTRTVDITPAGGSAGTFALANSAPLDALKTDVVTISGATFNALAALVRKGTSTASLASVTYSAGVPKSAVGTETVDSIKLNLTYAAPAFRAQAGCVTAAPYNPASSATCAFIKSNQAPNSQFYFQGTTYAPKAVLDIAINNFAEQVFRFGVIARSVRAFETGSVTFTGAVIEVPDDSPGLGFGVFLSTYICQGAGPCATTGTPNLTALVGFIDNATGPVAGAREVKIYSWSVPR